MRRWWVIAAILALATACTSSGGDDTSTAPASPAASSSPTSSTPTSTPPKTSASPTAPATPTVPADVPTTGPNIKPGERPPVMPVAATKHTAAGAKAFAVFFIKTIDWGFATESGNYIRHFSDQSCSSCLTLITGMDSDRRRGNKYAGGRISPTAAKTESTATIAAAQYTVAVSFNVTAFEKRDVKGKLLTGSAAQQGQQFEVSVAWKTASGGWTVSKLAVNP